MPYIMVPVPEERVPEVYALLGRPASASPSASGGGTDNGAAEWARDAIVRMYRESPPAMKEFLNHLADHPGRDFTTAEMAEATHHTQAELRGVLGAFGHRVSSRYRWESWPIDRHWDSEREMVAYKMSRDVADMIRSIR